MAKGFDGRELIKILKQYVPAKSSVLELGMGPGVDLAILAESFEVTGSDNAEIFLGKCHATHPEASLIHLDINAIQIDATFDAIYSNKVLHHLSEDELRSSLIQQSKILKQGGILLHSFWRGEGVEEIQGMRFTYY